jgi:hypothetical protein
LVLGFKNLSGKILGEDDRVLLLSGVLSNVTNIEKVRADGKMRAVLFQDAEWEKASSL